MLKYIYSAHTVGRTSEKEKLVTLTTAEQTKVRESIEKIRALAALRQAHGAELAATASLHAMITGSEVTRDLATSFSRQIDEDGEIIKSLLNLVEALLLHT